MKKFAFNLTLLSFMIIFLALTKADAAAIEGFSIEPSALYFSDNSNLSGTGSSKVNYTILDAKLGYTFNMGFFLGLKYLTYDRSAFGGKDSVSGYGPTIGYRYGGFHAMFTYLISGEEDLGGTEFSEGSGMSFDLGYIYMMNSFFGFGGQINYYSISFDERTDAGVTTSVSGGREKDLLYPSIAFRFFF